MKVTKEIIINFSKNITNQIEKFVEDICDYYNIDNSYFANILVALTEAVNIPVIGFNGIEVENSVKIAFIKKSKTLKFIINYGRIKIGKMNIFMFDKEDIDLNTEQGKLNFLISSLADTVNYNKTKNEIELVFETSSINMQKSKDRTKFLSRYFHTKKHKV